eukprot:CAMPEP_0195282694 /NCGR_PEP_ID=MMETSP0707-20130614/1480_1 /TAXON_ID=33640 /ORGANISM="Asterionellopsis glacialis, Strain CCMP134" /LENGTH=664 /DNA_ID=CAMNT_0040341715 /DNA_START=376 /DNA_END=2370 /DNA_ORIENTATION=-
MGRYDNDKLVAPPDFDGPTGDRRCTDVLCSILLLIAWGAMTAVGVYSITNGDYRVVLHPLDYDGNICGTDFGDIDMTEYPYLLYINSYTGGVCVRECPNLSNYSQAGVSDNLTDVRTLITYDGIYQLEGAELAPDFVQMANYSTSNDRINCINEQNGKDMCYPDGTVESSWESEGISKGFGWAYYVGDTYPWLQRCYLTDEAEQRISELVQANTTMSFVDAGYDFWNDLYADLWTARSYVLGCGFGLGVGISFIYITLLRFPCLLNMVVWGSIFATVGIFIAAGYYTTEQAKTWDAEVPQVWEDESITAARILGYVLWVLAGIFAFLMICLRKQIQLAIGCVRQASRALNRMPSMIAVPVLQALGLVAFMTAFLAYAVHLASLGEVGKIEVPIPGESGMELTFRLFEFDDFVENCAWYLLFCWFWTANFIVAVGDMIIAMSVAKWYFTWDKKTLGCGIVASCVRDTFRYHLGTCAYGSLIIAIVQYIRAVIAKIQKKIKELDSSIADAIMCCCQCIFWCFENCIQFINKNAYIQTAIFGTSFCKSAREAFTLILRNAFRVGTISYVSGAILLVGKFFISSIVTAIGYIAMSETIADELYNLAGPTVIIFLISYFVSDMFMDVFDMAITTILQCFVADEEMFQGDQCYAEGALQQWIDKNQESKR